MKFPIIFKIALSAFLLFSFHTISANGITSQNPIDVTPCQLADNPGEYNHKLVQVTGFVSHGFEEFVLFDPTCDSRFSIWLDYGGTTASNTMYCCGVTRSNTRPKQLVVENIPIPLTDDARFHDFNALVQKMPSSIVHATIVGRFFSGGKQQSAGGVFWRGYGHMGCCSLLAIQEIVDVDKHQREDLDYASSVDSPESIKRKCSSYRDLIPVDNSSQTLEAQKQADNGNREWSFNDPRRVASNALASFLDVKEDAITGLKEIRKTQSRVVYYFISVDKLKSYMLVINRPYILSFYAKDPKKIAWVVTAAYEMSC